MNYFLYIETRQITSILCVAACAVSLPDAELENKQQLINIWIYMTDENNNNNKNKILAIK